MTRREYANGGAREVCPRGNDLPQAKLNPELVREIRINQHGWTAKQWANHLGLHQRTIDKVRGYRSWIHV